MTSPSRSETTFDAVDPKDSGKGASDKGMHSESCYAFRHAHGEACEYDCPTCHGQPLIPDQTDSTTGASS